VGKKKLRIQRLILIMFILTSAWTWCRKFFLRWTLNAVLPHYTSCRLAFYDLWVWESREEHPKNIFLNFV
jgi:hypothetical protein